MRFRFLLAVCFALCQATSSGADGCGPLYAKVSRLKNIDRHPRVPALMTLHQKLFPGLATHSQLIATLTARENKTYGAYKSGKLIGFIILAPIPLGRDSDPTPQYEVDTVGVSPNHHRQGVATQLLEKVTKDLRKKGPFRLFAQTAVSGSKGAKLFENSGFKRFSVLPDAYGPNDPGQIWQYTEGTAYPSIDASDAPVIKPVTGPELDDLFERLTHGGGDDD